MVRKKKDPNTLTRTLCNWEHFNPNQMNILRFMCRESKNIYNSAIFHTQIYNRYSNQIFEKLFSLVKSKDITNPEELDAKLYEIYDKYFNHYLKIKSYLRHNNDVIYKFIKRLNLCIVNTNFQSFFDSIIFRLRNGNRLH